MEFSFQFETFNLSSHFSFYFLIIKLPHLLPIWGGCTSEFLKEDRKLCGARGLSVGSGRGRFPHVYPSVIFSQIPRFLCLIIVFCVSQKPVWGRSHTWPLHFLNMKWPWGFHAFLLILDTFQSLPHSPSLSMEILFSFYDVSSMKVLNSHVHSICSATISADIYHGHDYNSVTRYGKVSNKKGQ